MSACSVVTQELASLFGVLSHPQRVRIIEELRDVEHDVNFLSDTLGIRHSRVSQHLSLLRSHRLVKMRREGRHVFYRLANPEIARWLIRGLRFIEAELLRDDDIHGAVEEAREVWSSDSDVTTSETASPAPLQVD